MGGKGKGGEGMVGGMVGGEGVMEGGNGGRTDINCSSCDPRVRVCNVLQ